MDSRGFPKIGLPPNHPLFSRMFPYKPSILGTPLMETPFLDVSENGRLTPSSDFDWGDLDYSLQVDTEHGDV